MTTAPATPTLSRAAAGPTNPLRRGGSAASALAGLLAGALLCAGTASAQLIREDFQITNGTVNAVVRSGSTLYLGGSFTAVGSTSGTGVPINGVTGEAVFGFPRVTGQINAVISDGAGGWFIGGAFTTVGGVARANLAHILSDNSVAAWNPGASGQVLVLALDGSTLYAGGSFSAVGGQSRSNIAAVDAVTGAVTAWDPGAGSSVRALAVGAGAVYVGGSFTSIGATSRMRIAAIDMLSGAPTAWNPGANSTVRALVVDGPTLYAGGDFTSIGGSLRQRVAALEVFTGAATSWNPGANAQVSTLALDGSTLYVGGSFTTLGGQSRARLGSVETSTGTVSSWNPGANAQVLSLAVTGSLVYAGGDFLTIGGQSRSRLAAVDRTTGLANAWNPNAYGAVFALAEQGGIVYAAGFFTGLGGVLRNNLAAIDVTSGQVTAWHPDANSEVLALAVSGGVLYAGGSFTVVGGETRNGLAAFDTGTGLDTGWNPNVAGRVSALSVRGANVYAGGFFTDVGGQPRANLAAINAATGVPTSWNPGTDGEVFAVLRDDGRVYVGGTFNTAGGAARNNIAALSASTGLAQSWNPNANGTIRAIETSCGRVLVGGFYTTVGGQSRNRLAVLDATTGLASAWNPNSNGPVYDIDVDGRTVYVTGVLSNVGGQTRNRAAALDLTTGVATPWNPNSGGTVRTLARDAGSVYLGGSFSAMGATLQTNVAAMSADATLACPLITLSPASLPALGVGAAFSQSITALGGTGPYCYDLDGYLPPGITFDETSHLLSGTPTTPGTYSFSISTTDANGCEGSQAYVLEVSCPAIAVSPPALSPGAVGAPYARTFAASAGNAPLTWSVTSGSLPDGLALAPGTGVLSGTPTAEGTSIFTVQATDAFGCSGSENYTLDVFLTPPASVVAASTGAVCISNQNPCVLVPFVYSRADSTPARGISVTFQIDTTRFALCNAGPPALSIQPGPWLSAFPNSNFQVLALGGGFYTVDQAIFGVPCGVTSGGVLFTVALKKAGPSGTGLITVTQVKARDCSNLAIAAGPGPAATLLVHNDAIVVLPDTLPDLPVNAAYSVQLTASTGTQPVAFTVTAGSLPPGLSLAADGSLSGTPTAYGAYAFTVKATDAGGCFGTRAYALDVTCPVITVLPPTLPNAPIGVPYSQVITNDGGDPPVTFTLVAGALPPGLAFSPAGVLDGTPTTVGSYPFTLRATAVGGCFAERAYTLAVACPAMAVLPAALLDGVIGTPFVQSVSASSGIGPFTWAVTSGSLPAGLSLDSVTGEISGTPTTVATSVFNLRVTDSYGCTAVETYTLSILSSPPVSFVTAVAESLCLSTAHACVAVPVRFTRGETAPARAVSVTIQLEPAKLALCTPGSPASSVHQGTWLAGYPETQLLVLDLGGGRYSVDLAVMGSPCGTITGGELFTVDVQATGADGLGAITVVSAIARDCDNGPIGVLPGPVAQLSIQHAAPPAVADLATEQVLLANPPGGTTGVTVTWTPTAGPTSRLYRAPFGAYPLYDANGPVTPPDPAAAPGAPWTLVATNATPGYVDHPPSRGWWHYVVFAEDSCGNLSLASNASAGVLDYHLGDVSNGIAVGVGNNVVSDEDVSLLGANYGIAEPDITTRGVAYLDVGPTTDYLTTSRPLPDHKIDFEDFIIFAANYQVTSGPPGPARMARGTRGARGASTGALDEFSVTAPAIVQSGQLVTATVRLSGTGRVQGFSAGLEWNAAVVQPVSVAATAWFESQDGLALTPGQGRVDAALLGARETGLVGDVEVASVTFQAIASGSAGIGLAGVTARDAWNQPVATSIHVADVEFAAPLTTSLAQPSPNPSRGAIALGFALARAGRAELAIYGIDGRRIKVLAQGERAAGEYRLSWDGTDERGRAAAPGVYYARLSADGREFTRKLVRLDR